ncbi:MAG: glycosyltransferase family 2 protein [Pelobium sp.]
MIKVSVITVVFNNEKTIAYSINSVINQHYSNIEHIVIDGNSSDDTLQEIKKFETSIHTIISEPDQGIYDAINKGIKLASGDVIGILNSDDFFADNFVINRIVEEFKRDKELAAIYSNVTFVKRDNVEKIKRTYSSKYFRTWMLRFGFQPAHPTFYAKRELFDKYGLYRTDLKIAGDFELLTRFLLKKKIKFRYIDDIWVKMRAGGASTSGMKSVIKINQEIIKALKYNNIYSNLIFVYSKYLFKWWGFIRK